MAHTPGPWYNRNGVILHDIKDTAYSLAVLGPYEEAEADAKLMAAAPELFDALKDAYMELYAGNSRTLEDAMRRMHPNADGLEKKMVAAIKKATS